MSRPTVTRALVLAAGRGSRMGVLTDEAPKCLCPLAGRPVLAWTLEALQAQGITDILTIGGWQHQQLQAWCGQLRVNPDWSSANMGRSLLCTSDWLAQGPTLLVYGDGAYGRRAIAAALDGPDQPLVLPVDTHWLALWSRRFANPLLDAETLTRDGPLLTGIGQRAQHLEAIQGQFMGLLRIQPEGWAWISTWLAQYQRLHGSAAVDRLDMTSLLQGLVSAGYPIVCTDVAGGWVEIDSAEDCAVVEAALLDPDFLHDFRH